MTIPNTKLDHFQKLRLLVSPVGHLSKLKIYIDTNLERFTNMFAAAGHPNCVFEIEFNQLIKLTNGQIKEIAE